MSDCFRFGAQRSFLGGLRGCLRKKKYPAAKSFCRQHRYTDRELLAKLQAAANVQSHKRIFVSTSNKTANVRHVAPILPSIRFFWVNFRMGGPGSLVYMYLGEFHAERYRAKSICFLGFFFTLAWLILPGNDSLYFT